MRISTGILSSKGFQGGINGKERSCRSMSRIISMVGSFITNCKQKEETMYITGLRRCLRKLGEEETVRMV